MNGGEKSATSETVVFNVGGKMYEVSRSLIAEWPDTMLGRLVSDTWQGDRNKPVFIDRNGSIFELVLDYMRYGSITLPPNLPRSNFIREMDFYGISVEDEEVKQDSSVEELERLKQEVADAELKHDMFLLGVHAYHCFMTGKTAFFMKENDDLGLRRKPSDYANNSVHASNALKSYLETYYGLKAYDIIFSKTTGMSVKVLKLGAKEEGTATTETSRNEDHEERPLPPPRRQSPSQTARTRRRQPENPLLEGHRRRRRNGSFPTISSRLYVDSDDESPI